MSTPYLIIPDPVQTKGVVLAEGAPVSEFEVTWLSETGEQIGSPITVARPNQTSVEIFGLTGEPAWQITRADVAIPAVMPEGTQALRVDGTGLEPQWYPISGVSSAEVGTPPGPPLVRGNAAAAWRLAVVADGYDSASAFVADLDQLWNECRDARPFRQLVEEGLFGLVGLFWNSPDRQSLFGARQRDNNPWIIYGSAETVNDAVRQAGQRCDKVLVVMNRNERGGAGGFGSTVPSWTSNTSAEIEHWTQIALHELGHAFGLADEYTTAGNGTPPPDPLEPNVSEEPDPLAVSWHGNVTIANGQVPSLLFGASGAYQADDVGTFQGARYSKSKYYRPSEECRMRWVNRQFCPVCAKHIYDAVKRRA